MNIRTAIAGGMVFLLTVGYAPAVDWSTNLPSFHGGSYDGWDRLTTTASSGLGGADVTFSSAVTQALVWTQPQAVLTTLTVRVADPGSPFVITNGGALQVSVPATWPCRFDTNATLAFASNAASKVSTSVSYTNGDRTLVIPVTADFLTGDTLAVSGLSLSDLALCPAGSQRLTLDLDNDNRPDIYDTSETILSAPHPGGSYDGWESQVMASVTGLGGGQVSLTSLTNQVLVWTDPRGALTTLTVRVEDPGSPPMITNGGTLRLSVPAVWPCRFDTGATLSFSSNAASKVNTSVSYIGGGRTLVIPVTADFTTGDTLTVNGLALFDLHLCPAGPQKLTMDLDANGTADLYDSCAVGISVPHPGGSFDGWNRCETEKLQWYRIVGTLLSVR